MPVYTYQCENCGHVFDQQQSFSEDTLKVCPICKEHSLHKVYRAAGVVFKGSGFYVTDQKKSRSGNGKVEKPAEKSAKESKGETKKDTKTETNNTSAKSKPKED